MSHSYRLVQSISVLRVVRLLGGIFHSYSKVFFENPESKQDKRQTTLLCVHCAASDLRIHCLSMPHKKDARFTWVGVI